MRMAVFMLVGSLLAQTGPPVSIQRGRLVEWQASGQGGEFSLRIPDQHLVRCRFDENTWIDRDGVRQQASQVQAGEIVELAAERRGEAASCHALTIYVRRQETAAYRPRLRLQMPASGVLLDNLFPRGNLTFAGVVSSITAERLVLRTRNQGWQAFQLSKDTTFSAHGRLVQAEDLAGQTRVYVRAGRSFDGRLEAYHVFWGEILPAK